MKKIVDEIMEEMNPSKLRGAPVDLIITKAVQLALQRGASIKEEEFNKFGIYNENGELGFDEKLMKKTCKLLDKRFEKGKKEGASAQKKEIIGIIDKLFLDLSGEENLDDARKHFEEVRHKKFKKTKELFEILNSHQLAILFKLKQRISRGK